MSDAETPPADSKPNRPRVTWAAMAVCVVVFIGLNRESHPESWEALGKWGAGSADEIWSGAYWVLASSALVHQAIWHLAFNLYWLGVLGTRLEHAIGPLPYLALLVAAAVVSALLVAAAVVSSGWQLAASGATGIGDVRRRLCDLRVHAGLSRPLPGLSRSAFAPNSQVVRRVAGRLHDRDLGERLAGRQRGPFLRNALRHGSRRGPRPEIPAKTSRAGAGDPGCRFAAARLLVSLVDNVAGISGQPSLQGRRPRASDLILRRGDCERPEGNVGVLQSRLFQSRDGQASKGFGRLHQGGGT